MLNTPNELKIFELINSNTTVLTPNRRLSATLHKLYHQYQLTHQNKYWQTPDILPASTWIQRLFSEYSSQNFINHPYLLNTMQEQFLWEKVILQAKESAQLLQVSETAETTKSAFSLLKQWQINIDHPAFKTTEDSYALYNWVSCFRETCEKNNWQDLASLPEELVKIIVSKKIIPARSIILVGFTELSPQLKKLLDSCKDSGSYISQIELSHSQTQGTRIRFTDSEHEIVNMARFAKHSWKKNNSASIGCVIPTLDKIRDRVEQIFLEVFTAEDNSIQNLPFNISAGKNLSHYPIIHCALQLLALYKKIIPIETFAYLLTSPFLGQAESERIKRAHFDRLLRQANLNKINLPTLIDSSAEKKVSLTKTNPLLTNRIKEFFSLLDTLPAFTTYSEWAKIFSMLLTVLGWPGERSLNSEEYQTVENWLKLLEKYMTLDKIAKPVNYQQALNTLQKVAAKTSFQPQSPEAPIQVLGLLEAAGMPFDHLWVAGMDDLSWPPQPKPNPFIPKRLQRELQMPHATAQRELMFSEILTKQFKQSAKQVIFSHAEKNEELELQVSPLIRNLPEISINHLNLENYQTPSEKIYETQLLETIVDEKGPVLINNKIRGGMSVIKQQALCPFKAFAQWRLYAQELENTSPGLSNKERGIIVHKVLELVWNRIQNHERLISFEEKALNNLIEDCVTIALHVFTPSQYITLEKQRLCKLINDWLKLEKQRTPFKVVACEKVSEIKFNQLNLSVKIDRIDELLDGKKLIIDYKTGGNEINNWFGERPDEPQLPLYLLLDSENTIGISFAKPATGDHCFKGISRHDLEIKGIKLLSEIKKATALSWDEQLTQWRTVLTKLSNDFYQGVAKVDPKETKTCQYCALKPLCRIHEELNDAH